jgi:L-seryl-tRNA(Ser) seleniumtransferase
MGTRTNNIVAYRRNLDRRPPRPVPFFIVDKDLLRQLPKIDEFVQREAIDNLTQQVPRELVVNTARAVIKERRSAVIDGGTDIQLVSVSDIEREVVASVTDRLKPELRGVINATGVVLHTNLGRAPLCAEMLKDASRVASMYSNLEYDLNERCRGSRYTHTAELLRHLTGAEDSLVVNNNAGAMVLMLAAMATGREVIVSRGELIEIGGSFRLPEIFEVGGARLKEVGTTNRTHLRDFEDAICDDTALILKVHRSNFSIVGFTHEVDIRDLVDLGRARGVPVCEDLGSGCLVDLREYGISCVTVSEQVRAGLDVVTFSGDKLLGGPQAGILVGRRDLIERMRSHPLTRALRVDKFTLAALERTLITYVNGTWRDSVPTLALLTASESALQTRAKRLCKALSSRLGKTAKCQVEPSESRVGGGAMPETRLVSRAVRIRPQSLSAVSVDAALRTGNLPIVCRLDHDALVLDVRTIFDHQIEPVADIIRDIINP